MKSTSYERTRLRKVAALATGKSILDIGYAQMPNAYLSRFHRVGYDLNAPQDATVRYDEEICGDVCEITKRLRGRTFDTVICGELIEHLENPYEFLRSIRTLLAPAGKLILTTPNPLGFPVFLCELFRLRRFFYTREHRYYFLPRWVERLLETSGYDVAAVKSVGWWLPFATIGLCPVVLSYQVIYVATSTSEPYAATENRISIR